MAPLFAPGADIDPAVVERLTSYNVVVSYLFDPDGIFRGNLERLGVKTFIECPHRVLDGLGPAPSQLARPLEKLAMFLDDPAPRISPPNMDGPVERIILHPGSGSLRKNWALGNWREVLNRTSEAFPKPELVVVTGEAETERLLSRPRQRHFPPRRSLRAALFPALWTHRPQRLGTSPSGRRGFPSTRRIARRAICRCRLAEAESLACRITQRVSGRLVTIWQHASLSDSCPNRPPTNASKPF